MQDLSGKSVVLFCPKFFHYEKEIKKSLEGLGACVIWFDDRPSNNFYSKAVIRVNKNFLKRRINRYYDRVLNKIKHQNVDFLFFVNPESISVQCLSNLKECFPDVKCILYMWDSFKNRRQNIELLSLFDWKYTFDTNDALEYKLEFRPLFYIDLYRVQPNNNPKYKLLFIGTAHSDRYNLVRKLARSIAGDCKLYFYISSRLLFLAKKIGSASFRSVKYNDISFNSLAHKDIVKLMSESNAVLDINHPKQTGLTMRTFETLGAQRKLVTTNKSVTDYDFYNESNILIIGRDKPVIDPEFFNKPFINSEESILYKYSIYGWLTDIFKLR